MLTPTPTPTVADAVAVAGVETVAGADGDCTLVGEAMDVDEMGSDGRDDEDKAVDDSDMNDTKVDEKEVAEMREVDEIDSEAEDTGKDLVDTDNDVEDTDRAADNVEESVEDDVEALDSDVKDNAKEESDIDAGAMEEVSEDKVVTETERLVDCTETEIDDVDKIEVDDEVIEAKLAGGTEEVRSVVEDKLEPDTELEEVGRELRLVLGIDADDCVVDPRLDKEAEESDKELEPVEKDAKDSVIDPREVEGTESDVKKRDVEEDGVVENDDDELKLPDVILARIDVDVTKSNDTDGELSEKQR
ncbi:hypothetical protein CAC42_276 [Sphaceloma murrayae]|uniref:Uncharacterized protein n=1 Tax=Sphaceloma murrayae TaxID=2082308 RepID=A0A2K1QNH2_9PEZI|nr:hypothetical protein CAC42_276 [Sphaceloma murrayae]